MLSYLHFHLIKSWYFLKHNREKYVFVKYKILHYMKLYMIYDDTLYDKSIIFTIAPVGFAMILQLLDLLLVCFTQDGMHPWFCFIRFIMYIVCSFGCGRSGSRVVLILVRFLWRTVVDLLHGWDIDIIIQLRIIAVRNGAKKAGCLGRPNSPSVIIWTGPALNLKIV